MLTTGSDLYIVPRPIRSCEYAGTTEAGSGIGSYPTASVDSTQLHDTNPPVSSVNIPAATSLCIPASPAKSVLVYPITIPGQADQY